MRIPAAKNIGILISGRGSNMLAILDACVTGTIPGQVRVVISNVASAPGVMTAAGRGIPVAIHPYGKYPNREKFEQAIQDTIAKYEVEVIVLAGFMRVLSYLFIRSFPNRIINIHPSLLPAFPGLDPVRQALEHGVRVSGCTVHFVDEGTDTGPIISQTAVSVLPGDVHDTLAARILEQEHRLLSEALGWLLAGQLEIVGKRVIVHSSP